MELSAVSSPALASVKSPLYRHSLLELETKLEQAFSLISALEGEVSSLQGHIQTLRDGNLSFCCENFNDRHP